MKRLSPLIFVMILCVLAVTAVSAQDNTITNDDVNDIARKLYCPVCENIPLDTCGTAACDDWRNEIRLYLESGMTEQEIIDDFVMRFGDRVVGTPQDPVLRAMSLITPWVLTGLALMLALYTIIRWQQNNRVVKNTTPQTSSSPAQDDYRARLEQDLLQ